MDLIITIDPASLWSQRIFSTHDIRTSRCADYLLDHSGDEYLLYFLVQYCMYYRERILDMFRTPMLSISLRLGRSVEA